MKIPNANGWKVSVSFMHFTRRTQPMSIYVYLCPRTHNMQDKIYCR